ncbi:MAG TPA: hypothetical protein VHW02_10925 [Rhizomicrobium sp.]|jgi:cation transport ATPase|nr:hypothetical protein [Rhizomicrobium sp.]
MQPGPITALSPPARAMSHRDLGARFLFALALTVPLIAISSLGETHITDSTIAPLSRRWIEFVLAAPVVVWAAAPFFARALRGLMSGHASPFTPFAFGIFVLFAFSTVSLVSPSTIPMELHRYDGPTPLFFDVAALALTLMLGSELVQAWARMRLAKNASGPPLLMQNTADNIVNWLAPLSVLVGLAAYIYWAEYAPAASMWIGIHTAMAAWIAAALCMFTLAAPFAEFAALNAATRNGIAVGDARTLEAFANADSLVLDGSLVLEPDSTKLKPLVREQLSKLRENGLTVTVAAGETKDVAREIATEAALQSYVLANAVQDTAKQLTNKGKKVALATSTANGAALAMAAEPSAAIVLEKNDLAALVRVRRLSRAMLRNFRQNLAIAAVYNVIVVLAAAGVLLPFNGWVLALVPAAIAASLGPFLIIANALRLRRVRL